MKPNYIVNQKKYFFCIVNRSKIGYLSYTVKKYLILGVFFIITDLNIAQPLIPNGTTKDSIYADFITLNKIWPNYQSSRKHSFWYYKPTSYNALTSPILFAMHGVGGNGAGAISVLTNIADRRQALIIAPNLDESGSTSMNTAQMFFSDSLYNCFNYYPSTLLFKAIYRHVLARENRNNVPAYLIGFSEGGQFVTRYVLTRQAYQDSIPLKMAVSTSPYFYTFPTDTFNGMPQHWPGGLIFSSWMAPYINNGTTCPEMPNHYTFKCPDHKKQYYGANYGVLIGTADNAILPDNPYMMAQGNSRYQRAQNFYAFGVTNAPNYGVTCNWKYKEIVGVGHDANLMWNTKNLITDTFTIAERLLFDTPLTQTVQYAPMAAFYANTTTPILPNATVNFINQSTQATSYFWEFGDGSTSTQANPSHAYTSPLNTVYYTKPGVAGTFSVTGVYKVQLKATNANGCSNWSLRNHYIWVKNGGITKLDNVADNIISLNLIPNPANNNLTIQLSGFIGKESNISIFDAIGNNIYEGKTAEESASINTSQFSSGLYHVKVSQPNGALLVKKFIVEH